MRLARIGHATIVVRTDDVTCVMDPVLASPFDGGLVTFDPPIAVDAAAVAAACNLVILSHEHGDHFDVASLDRLDRDTLVYYPRGARLIANALERLGFTEVRALRPGEEDVEVADLRIVPTPSRVPFAEMGVVLAAAGGTAWNLVDSKIDDAIIAFAREQAGPIDVALAAYQPLIQHELCVDALGSGFPYAAYGALLGHVAAIAPRWVVPSACGFRYTQAWLDDRGFPVTEAQFARDVAALGRGALPVLLPPGGELALEAGALRRVADLPFVRRTDGATRPAHDWRPDRGVPPLVDRDPFARGAATLRREVAAFLDDELLAAFARPAHAPWRAKLGRLGAVWRLEVVYPGGDVETRWLDFGAGAHRWGPPPAAAFAGVHTSILASSLVGLRTGLVHPDRLTLGDLRTFTRLYEVTPAGLAAAGDASDEPLGRVLLDGSRERFLDRELRALGY